MMRRIFNLMAFLPGLVAASTGSARAETMFALPAPVPELVTREEAFRPFAETVSAEVERLLGVPAAVDDPATFRILLSTRVHLAHHFGDNEKAVATAAWIRSLQTDPAGRAFAGLTTLASVEARRRHPGAAPDDAAYRATFQREFSRHLAALPHTPDITAMLRTQREKIDGITEAALLREAREKIAPAIGTRKACTLDEADQIVRLRHRLVGIVPVRVETLLALDQAIAERTPP
jgi:hypothetical protein